MNWVKWQKFISLEQESLPETMHLDSAFLRVILFDPLNLWIFAKSRAAAGDVL